MSDEKKPEDAAAEGQPLDPQAWAKFLKRNSADASSGKLPTMETRWAWVIIFPEMFRPNTFDSAVEIGLEEVNSSMERKAQLMVASAAPHPSDGSDSGPEQREPTMVGAAFSMALTKMAIRTVNDHALQPHEVDLLWEALGFAGRQLVADIFMTHCCGVDAELQEKSRALVRVR